MKLKNNWLLWLVLVIVVVIIFPKPCGTKIPSQVLDYTCIGFETPLMSLLQKSDNSIDWCSGVCQSVSKNLSISSANNSQNVPGPISGITSSFEKIILPLGIIVIAILIVSWIVSIIKKQKTEIRVIRS